ncbi:MAG TPA: glycosyltransferase family 87 protein [Candidatus Obscuribacterales bacterium]
MQITTARTIRFVSLSALVLNGWLLGMFLVVTVFGRFADVMKQSPRMFQDFIRYYCCGKIALSPEHAMAYDPQVQFAAMESTLRQFYQGPMPDDYRIPFDYPPLVHVLMAPLATLPLQAAFVVWLFLSVAVLVAAVHLLLPRRTVGATVVWVLLISSSILTWRTLSMGQMSWLLFGLAGIYFWAVLHKRDLICGVVLTLLAALKPQYMLFLIVPLLLGKNWRALLSFAISAVIGLGAVCAIMGVSVVTGYPSVLAHVESADPYYVSMVCLRSLFAHVLSGVSLKAVSGAIFLSGLMAVGFFWRWAFRHGENEQRWAAALTILVALLSSPHAHNFDALLVLLCGVLTIPTLNPEAFPQLQSGYLKIWLLLVVAYVPLSWLLLGAMAAMPVWQNVIFVLVFSTMIAVGFRAKRSSLEGRDASVLTTAAESPPT